MKAMISFIFSTCLLLLASSCKDEPEPPKPTDTERSPVVWKVQRDRKELATNNFIYKDWIIQGVESTALGTKISALTLDSGKVIWENTDYKSGIAPNDVEETFVYNNFLILSVSSILMVIDLDNGKTIWRDELEGGAGKCCVIDGYVYKTARPALSQSYLYRYDIQTGAKELVMKVFLGDYDDLHKPRLLMPAKWVHPSGDEILIMQNRSFGWGTTGKTKMDVLAWNMTADSMLWYRHGLDDGSSTARPVVDGDKVFFYGKFHAYCLHAATGQTKWAFETFPDDLEGDFNTANILIVKDKLIVKPDSRWIYAVNKESGQLLWHNTNTRAMPGILREHNDTIWFASGAVVAVDANTGEKLIDYYPGAGYWSNPVMPHPTNGNIYTTDGEFILCMNPKYMK